jgi:hypothetical protein
MCEVKGSCRGYGQLEETTRVSETISKTIKRSCVGDLVINKISVDRIG